MKQVQTKLGSWHLISMEKYHIELNKMFEVHNTIYIEHSSFPVKC